MIQRIYTIREQVSEFHNVYDHPIRIKPGVPADDRVRLGLALIAEEFFETLRACLPESYLGLAEAEVMADIKGSPVTVDLPGFIDGLADLDYVVEGRRLEFGVDGGPIAAEVHRSNMSKLGPDGKPIKSSIGKVLKGPNFTPPDIAGELRKQGWEG